MNRPALPRVRAAKPEDFPAIMRLCRMLYEENGMADVIWPRVEQTVFDGVNGNRSLIGVIGTAPCENLHGMLLLRFSQMWYSDEPVLEELYNYVPPEHRKSGNARALLEFAKAASDRLEIPLLIGILSTHRTRAKVRLYERVFGEPAGAFFLYRGMSGRPQG